MSGEKTEEATEKKKKDSLKKGQVAISKDVQTLGKLLGFYIALFYAIGYFGLEVENYFNALVDLIFKDQVDVDSIFSITIDLLVTLTLPLALLCVVISSVMTWIQAGFVYAPESIVPSFKKFNAVENIKQMFSKKSLVQLLLSFVKIVILALVSWLVLVDSFENVTWSYRGGIDEFLALLVHLLKVVIFVSLAIFVVLSFIDWIATFYHHKKSIKMSKNEVKDENKQQYGNQAMKSKRKREHRNLINSSLSKMPQAKAVVANPTHISIALDYEPGVHDLPFILAMGEDEDALLIRKEAERHGIPIVQNVVLARRLYSDCEEEEYIQEQHLEMVAELFRLVFRLDES